MAHEPPEEYLRKLRIAEDLAYRLQKPEWQTRNNREKLESLIKESLCTVRARDMLARRRRMEALEKAQERVDSVRVLGSRDTNQTLDGIFYLLRTARQGR